VVVVGGGIAGLAAAWELVTAGRPSGSASPEVHLLESAPDVGGKLQSADFAGRTVDLAADAFLARRPEATDLCRELGLTGAMVPVGASGASIWARGRLRTMPAGLNLGVPTRWWPLFRSGILSAGESFRVGRDLVTPHRADGVVGDRAVGAIVSERLGRPVVERLVDPLVGGINAGGVDDLSAAATFPVLIGVSHQPGSLMRRLGQVRPQATGTGTDTGTDGRPDPVFWSLTAGTASLAGELGAALVRRGVTVRTGTTVESMERTGVGATGATGWRLHLAGPTGPQAIDADGVILAVPASEAAVLLLPHAPEAAGQLSAVEYASVGVVTLTVPEGSVPTRLAGTGFLVPRTSTIGGHLALITGCTYLGHKWPHLGRPGDELLRVSVGRFGDDRYAELDDAELTDAVVTELAVLLGVTGRPSDSMVTRWSGAFPQYRVGHLLRVGRIEQALADLGGIAVAGAAYRGVGIPACIGSGRNAARVVTADLASGARTIGPPPRPDLN
jgi:oxygen-dependent protoporphyrinogen oxidase